MKDTVLIQKILGVISIILVCVIVYMTTGNIWVGILSALLFYTVTQFWVCVIGCMMEGITNYIVDQLKSK